MVAVSQRVLSVPVPSTTSRSDIRRGLVVGVVGTFILVSLTWLVTNVAGSGPRTSTTSCNGAGVTGTTWVDDSQVVVSVSVLDAEPRDWEVRWGTYSEEVRGGAMTAALSADHSGSLSVATAILGDTDGGTHRTAEVRPRGGGAWCELDMRVSLIW